MSSTFELEPLLDPKFRDTLLALLNWKEKELYLVGFPDHPNVGDSAIWLSTIAIFEDLDIKILGCIRENAFISKRLLKKLGNDENLVFVYKGGGDLGGRYPHVESLIAQLLKSFPNSMHVIFPQSVDLTEKSRLGDFLMMTMEKDNLFIFARDRTSHDYLRDNGFKVFLTRDIVHQMKLTSSTKDVQGVVLLMRNDPEKLAKIEYLSDEFWRMFDWPAETYKNKIRCKFVRASQKFKGFRSSFLSSLISLEATRKLASERLGRGIASINTSNVVISDRLHGVILAYLIGKKVYAIDNLNGKVHNYVETWGSKLESVVVLKEKDYGNDLSDRINVMKRISNKSMEL
jgi:exopolysaccharide biosynthesis predicted pyruvyltransferase EpsI